MNASDDSSEATTVRERLNQDMKSAMREKDKKKVGVLRMLLSEIQYAQTAKDKNESISEGTVKKVIASYHKKLTKSLSDYPDETKKDEIRSEIGIIEAYLPKKASEEEVKKVISEVLSGSSERNSGVVMKAVLARLGESGDGSLVSRVLKSELSS